MCIHVQLNPVEASIIQPSPEELRKKQLANELFGMGGGGLSGPARAPRHKPRKGNLGKVDPTPQQRAGGQSEVKTVETTDLLLDLQVSKRNKLYTQYRPVPCTIHAHVQFPVCIHVHIHVYSSVLRIYAIHGLCCTILKFPESATIYM